MNLYKKLKELQLAVKQGRASIKELEAMRKKWEAAGCPGLERKK